MVKVGKLVVIGAGGHARVVVDAARSAGYQLHGIVDKDFKGQKENILGCPVIGGIESLNKLDPEVA